MIYQTQCHTSNAYTQTCQQVPAQTCYPETVCHKTPHTKCHQTRTQKCTKTVHEVPVEEQAHQCLSFSQPSRPQPVIPPGYCSGGGHGHDQGHGDTAGGKCDHGAASRHQQLTDSSLSAAMHTSFPSLDNPLRVTELTCDMEREQCYISECNSHNNTESQSSTLIMRNIFMTSKELHDYSYNPDTQKTDEDLSTKDAGVMCHVSGDSSRDSSRGSEEPRVTFCLHDEDLDPGTVRVYCMILLRHGHCSDPITTLSLCSDGHVPRVRSPTLHHVSVTKYVIGQLPEDSYRCESDIGTWIVTIRIRQRATFIFLGQGRATELVRLCVSPHCIGTMMTDLSPLSQVCAEQSGAPDSEMCAPFDFHHLMKHISDSCVLKLIGLLNRAAENVGDRGEDDSVHCILHSAITRRKNIPKHSVCEITRGHLYPKQVQSTPGVLCGPNSWRSFDKTVERTRCPRDSKHCSGYTGGSSIVGEYDNSSTVTSQISTHKGQKIKLQFLTIGLQNAGTHQFIKTNWQRSHSSFTIMLTKSPAPPKPGFNDSYTRKIFQLTSFERLSSINSLNNSNDYNDSVLDKSMAEVTISKEIDEHGSLECGQCEDQSNIIAHTPPVCIYTNMDDTKKKTGATLVKNPRGALDYETFSLAGDSLPPYLAPAPELPGGPSANIKSSWLWSKRIGLDKPQEPCIQVHWTMLLAATYPTLAPFWSICQALAQPPLMRLLPASSCPSLQQGPRVDSSNDHDELTSSQQSEKQMVGIMRSTKEIENGEWDIENSNHDNTSRTLKEECNIENRESKYIQLAQLVNEQTMDGESHWMQMPGVPHRIWLLLHTLDSSPQVRVPSTVLSPGITLSLSWPLRLVHAPTSASTVPTCSSLTMVELNKNHIQVLQLRHCVLVFYSPSSNPPLGFPPAQTRALGTPWSWRTITSSCFAINFLCGYGPSVSHNLPATGIRLMESPEGLTSSLPQGNYIQVHCTVLMATSNSALTPLCSISQAIAPPPLMRLLLGFPLWICMNSPWPLLHIQDSPSTFLSPGVTLSVTWSHRSDPAPTPGFRTSTSPSLVHPTLIPEPAATIKVPSVLPDPSLFTWIILTSEVKSQSSYDSTLGPPWPHVASQTGGIDLAWSWSFSLAMASPRSYLAPPAQETQGGHTWGTIPSSCSWSTWIGFGAIMKNMDPVVVNNIKLVDDDITAYTDLCLDDLMVIANVSPVKPALTLETIQHSDNAYSDNFGGIVDVELTSNELDIKKDNQLRALKDEQEEHISKGDRDSGYILPAQLDKEYIRVECNKNSRIRFIKLCKILESQVQPPQPSSPQHLHHALYSAPQSKVPPRASSLDGSSQSLYWLVCAVLESRHVALVPAEAPALSLIGNNGPITNTSLTGSSWLPGPTLTSPWSHLVSVKPCEATLATPLSFFLLVVASLRSYLRSPVPTRAPGGPDITLTMEVFCSSWSTLPSRHVVRGMKSLGSTWSPVISSSRSSMSATAETCMAAIPISTSYYSPLIKFLVPGRKESFTVPCNYFLILRTRDISNTECFSIKEMCGRNNIYHQNVHDLPNLAVISATDTAPSLTRVTRPAAPGPSLSPPWLTWSKRGSPALLKDGINSKTVVVYFPIQIRHGLVSKTKSCQIFSLKTPSPPLTLAPLTSALREE